ncbi:MAG: MFS transporter [Planctomycetales bacterium]|nr:MFS transporter [Planctomycetales bacterium]
MVQDDRPSLNQDKSFWGMISTQFLGAFNDNLFKQLVLLLAIPTGAAAASMASMQQEKQDEAAVLFALPFILFSGIAGYLSDRYSKRRVIVICKVAEIAAMILGMLAFIQFGNLGYTGLLVVLFLMGMQSAFFGPGKYGILPELFRTSDLPRANGIMLMTTFLAIILGTITAGVLKDVLIDKELPMTDQVSKLWIASFVCIGIAIVGTLTSLMVRPIPASNPKLQLTAWSFFIPKSTLAFLRTDWPLVSALGASSVFWLVSGIAILAVNSFGLRQLGLDDTKTSLMPGMIAIGIAVGSVIAGRLCHGKVDFRIVRIGLLGLTLFLAILGATRTATDADKQAALSTPASELTDQVIDDANDVPPPIEESMPALPNRIHLLGFGGSCVALVFVGVSAGFFAIPVQVFIQSRPPDDQKGQMIAVMNLANFTAILLSGVIYGMFDKVIAAQGWPRSHMFLLMAFLLLPMVLFYRPKE